MNGGDPGIDRDVGVFDVDSFGVLGVELTRFKVGFGRRFWISCIDVNPCRRFDCGGTEYGHVRCRDGLVGEFLSGAAIVTFRDGILRPGDVGL